MSSESAAASGAIADLPTGEPIPSPAPSAVPSSSKPTISNKKQSASMLQTLLTPPTPTSIDAFLTHLHKCMSTPTGIDTVLQFICYTSKFGASILTSLSANYLRRSTADWIALITANKTTVVQLAREDLPVTRLAAVAFILAQRLNKLSGLLSEARTMLRLWALLGMYFWAKKLISQSLAARRKKVLSEKGEPVTAGPTTLDTTIAYSQLITCVVFQALENGAYLSSKGVMGWSPAKQGWAMKWSVRLWGVYIGIDLGRLAAEAAAGGRGKITPAWKSSVVRQLAWAPLTMHWGSDTGLVSDWMVGALASIPSVVQMRELWAQTA